MANSPVRGVVGEAKVAQKETIKPARTQDVASIPLAVLIPDGAHAKRYV